MAQGFVKEAILRKPQACASVQAGDFTDRQSRLQLLLQHFAEQRMIDVPLALIVQDSEENTCALQRVDGNDICLCVTVDHRSGQRRRNAFQDRGFEQERLHGW